LLFSPTIRSLRCTLFPYTTLFRSMVHVAHGMVSLEDGALSTRTGRVIFLEDVLNTAVAKAGEIIAEKNPDLENRELTAEQVGVRSEEHTSELQSRFDLVCRLLLEK